MLFIGQFNEEKDLSSAFKNPQWFYIPVDYMYILMRSYFWFWAIVKLIKSTDFLCKLSYIMIMPMKNILMVKANTDTHRQSAQINNN